MLDNTKAEIVRLLTYRQAAELLCIPYFKVQRAASSGIIPTYSLLNTRRYVKLSDIEAQLKAHN